MGTAAIAGRAPLAAGRPTRASAGHLALAFHARGGPLVAVCGLVGGAGASTLAYLLARRAARHSTAPVLLTELSDGGGLTALTGAAGPLGLRALARAVDEERQVPAPFTELAGGLRLVASAHPAPTTIRRARGLGRLLADAREAHGLVVVDGGRLPVPDHTELLAAATHLLLVLPATAPALGRAEQLAAAGALDQRPDARTALVAIAPASGRRTRLRELRRLAERPAERLLLVPHVPALADADHHQADGALEDTFAALATYLRRQP